MPRFNERNLLPNAKTVTLTQWTTRGNSYVHDYAPTKRMPQTAQYWRQHSAFAIAGTAAGASVYATNGSNLHAIGNSGAYYTSPALNTASEVWTARTSPFASGVMRGLLWLNNVWYAVGNNMGYGGIYTSSDGITWTSRVSGLGVGKTWDAIYGRYNGYYGRWEITAYPSNSLTDLYSTIDNAVTWTTNALGWSPQSLVHASVAGAIYFTNNYAASPYYLAYHYPGPYAPTALTNPFGSTTMITAIGGASVMTSAELLVATYTQLAVSTTNPASTFTFIEPPPLGPNEFIKYISTVSGPNLGQITYIVTTSETRIFNATVSLGANNRVWTDISPPPMTQRTSLPTYRPLPIDLGSGTTYVGTLTGGILKTKII